MYNAYICVHTHTHKHTHHTHTHTPFPGGLNYGGGGGGQGGGENLKVGVERERWGEEVEMITAARSGSFRPRQKLSTKEEM